MSVKKLYSFKRKKNLVKNHQYWNSEVYLIPVANKDQYEHSFFVKTTLELTNLDNDIYVRTMYNRGRKDLIKGRNSGSVMEMYSL